MAKDLHEIRDPIHNFIRIESEERSILDSRPVQRLRHIHQLAMTFLVYPGATHRRFEHSLGVMELAGRVFDIVTKENHLYSDAARDVVPRNKLDYWRQVVRMAALCHDIGHLPFSHAAEKLLPDGWDHERLTDDLIRGDDMARLWKDLKINPEDVAKLALGPKKFGPKKHRDVMFSPWEAILAEIIVGDAFGADRMDYLLRDSYHAGVAYGRFDHFRLIDTLRILPHEQSQEVTLGIEAGGLHSAEALLLARYFMYTQLYFHPIRRIYDYHLSEFLKAWLPNGKFNTELSKHLQMTDNDVNVALMAAAYDEKAAGHRHARAIYCRDHFRHVYERNPQDIRKNPRATAAVARFLVDNYGQDNVHILGDQQTEGFPGPIDGWTGGFEPGRVNRAGTNSGSHGGVCVCIGRMEEGGEIARRGADCDYHRTPAGGQSMKDSQREALVLEFVRRLKAAGSWCGETHVQKSTYFLQELMTVPLGFNFIFYKHGPYSFDLNDQLTALQSNGLVDLRSHEPYGPHLHASPAGAEYLGLFPKTIARYEQALGFVVDKLARRNVAELERLATALYVRKELPNDDEETRARRVTQLKPHVSIQEARFALREVEDFDQERIAMMSE